MRVPRHGGQETTLSFAWSDLNGTLGSLNGFLLLPFMSRKKTLGTKALKMLENSEDFFKGRQLSIKILVFSIAG